MASIQLSIETLKLLKIATKAVLPSVKSSHLTEAIAFATGEKTNAALLSHLKHISENPNFVLLNEDRLIQRLSSLGYQVPSNFSFDQLGTNIIKLTGKPKNDRSVRRKVWRNLLTAGINEAIRRKLIGLNEDDNWWPGADERNNCEYIFSFTLPSGSIAKCHMYLISHGELQFNVAVNPKGDHLIEFNPKFRAGDAWASGWLERKDGAWIQESATRLSCRKFLLKQFSDLNLTPIGYGNSGKFYR